MEEVKYTEREKLILSVCLSIIESQRKQLKDLKFKLSINRNHLKYDVKKLR